VLLDTNAYTALALGKQQIVEMLDGVLELKLPLPVIAELRYGFMKGSRAEHNEQILQRFLAQSHALIVLPTLETATYYAELQLLCKKRGRALSHNDIWIAALAREANDSLVTFDKDFAVLKDILGDKLIILE
jgi:tRNA(fMet)-specific endonuclease VapC